jgi:hypothetical protein
MMLSNGLNGLAAALVFLLVIALFRMVRKRGVQRRRAAQEAGRLTDVPARLRGVDLAYPGFLRAGRVDLGTARWRPYGRWGIATSLAGGRTGATRTGSKKYDGLRPLDPPYMLDCVATDGRRFQLAIPSPEDADLIRQAMQGLPAALSDPATESAPLRWLRQRLPGPAAFVLVGLVLWIAALIPATATISDLTTRALLIGMIPAMFLILLAVALGSNARRRLQLNRWTATAAVPPGSGQP